MMRICGDGIRSCLTYDWSYGWATDCMIQKSNATMLPSFCLQGNACFCHQHKGPGTARELSQTQMGSTSCILTPLSTSSCYVALNSQTIIGCSWVCAVLKFYDLCKSVSNPATPDLTIRVRARSSMHCIPNCKACAHGARKITPPSQSKEDVYT